MCRVIPRGHPGPVNVNYFKLHWGKSVFQQVTELAHTLYDTLVKVDIASDNFSSILFACPYAGMLEKDGFGTGHKSVRDSSVVKVMRWSGFGTKGVAALQDMFSMRGKMRRLRVIGCGRDKELQGDQNGKQSRK